MRLEGETAKGNILIVEDDKGVAHLQALRLERVGHSVKIANSAAAALLELEQSSFDLIVLDYSLSSDVNGITLFLTMKEKGLNIPAILVTGFEDLKLILQAMRAGIRDFLPKTADYLDELPLSVERVLKQVALEYQAAESAQIKEKQQLLEVAHERIKALNDRLQLSIIETHHRAKNNLQSIISLLHLQKGKNLGMTEDEVKKLSFQIQGLATFQDFLVGTVKDDEGDTTKVNLKELLESIASAIGHISDSRPIITSLEDCQVTPRQASSISVIANELLSNALKHGKGSITLKLSNFGEHAEFEVINQGSIFPENFNINNSDRTGLLLVQALAQADLHANPIFYNPDNHAAAVKITFSLSKAI